MNTISTIAVLVVTVIVIIIVMTINTIITPQQNKKHKQRLHFYFEWSLWQFHYNMLNFIALLSWVITNYSKNTMKKNSCN